MTHLMRTASGIAMMAAASMLATTAMSADLGGNCCTDLEERVAELEATTVRKGNRKVSLQLYGQVSESVIWWNDGAESNVFVQENNYIKNTLGVQGSAKITSDWSAGYKMELQIRAFRSSNATQLALGSTNGVQIPVYNTQSVSLRHAYWYLQSNHYGRITVGRDVDSTVGTSTMSLVNPDGFSGPSGPGFAQGGFLLRGAGTTGNAGLSTRTWQNTAWINNGDGPLPFDYAQTKPLVKYTSPFFLGHSKSSGFQFSADWGADDAWGTALRYAEEFGAFRVAAGIGYQDFRGPDRGFCTDASNSQPTGLPNGNPSPNGLAIAADGGSDINCNSLQMSASVLHTPTGLYVSGGYAELNNRNAAKTVANSHPTNADQVAGIDGKSSFWYVIGGWQAKLNPLGNTIFWGQYVDVQSGLHGNAGRLDTFSTTDPLAAGVNLGGAAAALIRSAHTQSWGLGVSQNVDAAAMTLYAGFHNISTEVNLGAARAAGTFVLNTAGVATATAAVAGNGARARSNPIDDMQVFYTGATIRF